MSLCQTRYNKRIPDHQVNMIPVNTPTACQLIFFKRNLQNLISYCSPVLQSCKCLPLRELLVPDKRPACTWPLVPCLPSQYSPDSAGPLGNSLHEHHYDSTVQKPNDRICKVKYTHKTEKYK